MTVFAVFLFILGLVAIVVGVLTSNKVGIGIGLISAAFLFLGGHWMQTHRVVGVNTVGIAKNTFTQEFTSQQESGLIDKPFFGSVTTYPASTDFEQCDRFTPPIKGSYEIIIDYCGYFDQSQTDWVAEINSTGKFTAKEIMAVWRTGVVGAVSAVVSDKTPDQMNTERAQIEEDIYLAMHSWYAERGIVLNRGAFKFWDFSSEAVGAAYDESIGVQRKVAEQDALFAASEKVRIRELYEAETLQLVGAEQLKAAQIMGISEDDIVEWLWMQYFRESGTAPDYMVLGSGNSEPAIAVSP